jgi:hypothetical protein
VAVPSREHFDGTVSCKADKCDHVTTDRGAPPPTDDFLLPTYHLWPPSIDPPRLHSPSAGSLHPLRASESPPPTCTRRPPLEERALSGRTTRLVPDAPEMPLNPALGPLVSDVVVSGSIYGNGFVRDNNLFYLLCLLYLQFSFIFT